MNFASILSREFNIPLPYAQNLIDLLDEGYTIPFIARYRKEQHGTLDDQVLRQIADRLTYLRNLEARKEEVRQTIAGQDKLTPELDAAITAANTLTEVEDIYRPYRPKRRTRATVARERGLEPLAEILFRQEMQSGSPTELAAPYIDPAQEIHTWEDALAGAMDIMAEDMSDDATVRAKLRDLIHRRGQIIVRGTGEEDSVYGHYYDFRSPVKTLQSHQILAINRGEKEKFLKVDLEIEEPAALDILNRAFVRPGSITSHLVADAAGDALTRLILPSVQREMRSQLTESAGEQAIAMFALNLNPLLMQPPVKNKITLGLDPAYRTGCKLAVVDGTGKVLDTAVIYPTPPMSKIKEAAATLQGLIERHQITCIAIGNGTASGEAEAFVADTIREMGGELAYMVVNEAGASVYSASKLAAEEFPQLDVTLRSAVSIARRLQDPLAELVKIDPKSIGVGQYQHDMPQARLGQVLSAVVEDCVNRVGVDLNVASVPLLEQISGLTATTAKNIVAYREEHGPFPDRKALRKVSKLGPKAYEQCAGFLRVPESKQILDNTSVHPESYKATERLLSLLGYALADVKAGNLTDLQDRLNKLGILQTAEQCGIGAPTLEDIVENLQKPGRDPRDELPPPLLRRDVMDMADLTPGLILSGTVRNVVDFGAFVDIGVHQDGLVHISELADRYVRHPSEMVTVGDVVQVVVLQVEQEKKRIGLSMKQVGQHV
ncbi:MAG: RNA-binding transcriptional accessory protein [Oscillospiraceae bacterium]|nr:RNA-binding transcriptional accessory protein [Oscillospiraceae bacterium]